MTDPHSSPLARIRTLRQLSPIWLVPIVAAVIGLWLVYVSVANQGPLITLIMKDADGIEAGKTMIKSRSVEVGTVQSVRLSEDLSHVILTARMAVDAESLLRADSQWWVVKPRIERQGISGLGTLLSGAYIELSPGKSKQGRKTFDVLESPPVAQSGEKGLRLRLLSEQSRGLNPSDPVVYRGFVVGRVEKGEFLTESRQMEYQLFISAPYDSLVTSNTRFWVNNGMRFQASAEGIRVETGTLEALIRGGVSFDVPPGWSLGQPAGNNQTYALFPDEASSRSQEYRHGLDYVLLFDDSVRGLTVGAPVEYRGIRVGTVQTVPYLIQDTELLGSARNLIPVLIRIEPGRIGREDSEQGKQSLAGNLAAQVARGLRASLKTGNLLTGALYVDFNYYPESAPVRNMGHYGDYPVLPTHSGGLARLEQQVNNLLNKLNQLPLESSLGKLDAMLGESQQSFAAMRALSDSLNKLANQPASQQLPAELTRSLQSLQQTLQAFSRESPAYVELSRSIESLTGLLRELKPVARSVNEKPNALIFNRQSVKDPQPRRAE